MYQELPIEKKNRAGKLGELGWKITAYMLKKHALNWSLFYYCIK